MASLKPEGIHILAGDGTVRRANLKDRQAGRARARDLSRGGSPVMLFDPRDDYRRLYVNGKQDKSDLEGVAAMRDGAFRPVDGGAPRRAGDDGGMRSHRTAAARPTGDDEQADWTDQVEALGDRGRAAPASAFDTKTPEAKQSGVYAWWADETACLLIEKTLCTEVSPLIYIGQTTRLLRQRIREHLGSKIGKSTLRKSLTAILMTDPTLATQHPHLDARDWLDVLSDWMRRHLAVAIVPVGRELVKDAEQAVIARYDPPLNLPPSVDSTPGRECLEELRRQLKHA